MGIVTGTISKIFVVDVDSEAALAWAIEKLPPCDLRVRTAKGLHLYLPVSGERPMRNKCRVKYQGETLDIDFRANGELRGAVLASYIPTGHLYVREGTGWRWS